ncbi:hypothetical protein J3T65_00425 [Staphylococcus simiae]|uniref:hypothetical protein n=1 Tax=Staphylococcus simiae TaxID=308354 RepID=UPI001A959758|nr:hypothetical protein [Staphylococcus simiae]MBO1197927.1 hypothetical protein [Staphylococcus simiae]MBO1200118.1 hypothetical protein [Staphylococcus simiae]MBO1202391.1 hypothetical protein [Staphylococcus simiae]MBO1209918.1 hypothetical protein [Staphylococcus simiae]MBO1228535.1 hypothetical protein [Staphylococcus simiae]
MKKLISIVGVTFLLAGCGTQHLAPLEDKTTDLRDSNHQLKLDIQELNQQISDSKSKIQGLEKDKKDSKKTATNNTKIKKLNATSHYYDSLATALQSYKNIEQDVSKNKGQKSIQQKLDKISNNITDAHDQYTEDIDGHKLSKDEKNDSKVINKLNKNLTSAFDDISTGYQNKDKKQIQRGQKKLAKLNINSQ